MIVKDEGHVIERCLLSVKDFISHWVIVDTGSTDNTKEVITRVMGNIPGEIVDRPWKDFGHNRTEALDLARSKADYSLWIDADDIIVVDGNPFKELTASAYSFLVKYGSTVYTRAHLFNNQLPWKFEGVIHEYPHANGINNSELLLGITYCVIGGGARSKQDKFSRDIKILEEALLSDPDNVRYVFYLAQSYRDAKEYEKAIKTYDKRVKMGGFQEEVWCSLYQIARLYEFMGLSQWIISAYLKAYDYRPQRAESIYSLAKYCRLQENYNLAFMFADIAKNIKRTCDVLFVDESVYDWRALDEFAISAYYVGRYDASFMANNLLITSGKLPSDELERIISNRNFGLERIASNNGT
jgi:glycosyltransferase involved in cell wall biosynthesis